MPVDILDSVRSLLGSHFVRQTSAFFGESAESTRAGLGASAAGTLAALVRRSEDASGAADVFRVVSGSAVDSGIEAKLAGIVANRGSYDPVFATGESLQTSVFGNRTGSVACAVSQVAGVRPSTATALLAMTACLVLGLLKKQVVRGGLAAGGLAGVLLAQRSALQRAGLDDRIASALGHGSLQNLLGPLPKPAQARAAMAAPYGDRQAAWAATVDPHPRERHRVLRTLGLGALAVIVVLLSSRWMPEPDAPRAQLPAAGSPIHLASLPAKVYFHSGQASIDPANRRALAAVAASARANGSSVALTGYADRTGNAEQNLSLAQDRAAAVRDVLVSEGLPGSSIVVTPPQFVADAPADAQARHVEISPARSGP